jgi:hypothetical protein
LTVDISVKLITYYFYVYLNLREKIRSNAYEQNVTTEISEINKEESQDEEEYSSDCDVKNFNAHVGLIFLE